MEYLRATILTITLVLLMKLAASLDKLQLSPSIAKSMDAKSLAIAQLEAMNKQNQILMRIYEEQQHFVNRQSEYDIITMILHYVYAILIYHVAFEIISILHYVLVQYSKAYATRYMAMRFVHGIVSNDANICLQLEQFRRQINKPKGIVLLSMLSEAAARGFRYAFENNANAFQEHQNIQRNQTEQTTRHDDRVEIDLD